MKNGCVVDYQLPGRKEVFQCALSGVVYETDLYPSLLDLKQGNRRNLSLETKITLLILICSFFYSFTLPSWLD